jgi:hypothetical protein
MEVSLGTEPRLSNRKTSEPPSDVGIEFMRQAPDAFGYAMAVVDLRSLTADRAVTI